MWQCETEIFCNTLEQHRHCRYCDRSFTTDYKCRRHFNEAHGSRAVDVKGKMCYPCKVRHKNLGKCKRAHYHCPICDSTLFIRQRFQNHVLSHDKSLQAVNSEVTSVNPILPGLLTWGGRIPPPLMFFFHHHKTAQAMKLKLSDLKDTCLRHILQFIPDCYILRCYHGNKITKGTLQNLTQ